MSRIIVPIKKGAIKNKNKCNKNVVYKENCKPVEFDLSDPFK